MAKPSPSVTTVQQAVLGGAVGYILSQLNNPFIPSAAAQANIAGATPLLTGSDRLTLIQIAQEQGLAGEVMMHTGSASEVPLFDIPVQAGVQSNKVQVDVRVEIFDPTRTDQGGRPIKVTHGVVTCTSSLADLDQNIAECVDSWVDHMVENVYKDLGGVQISTDVIAARRGSFFGR